jgi:MurNAc alpha-1-phosphate uridylyltransferase
MILAAGFGSRMRPITDHLPKPLVPVGGHTLIDRILDRLFQQGIEQVVINIHYKGEMIAQHLAARNDPRISILREDTPLETGGGVLNALPMLGSEPFFVINSDVIWLDGKIPTLARLANAWDDARTDALLLLQRTTLAVGYEGEGDFFLDQLGMPRRRSEIEIAPYIFAGIQLLHPRTFDGMTSGKFSLNRCWDRLLAAERLQAIVHDGEWFHVGTPDGLHATSERLDSHRIER